MAASHPILVVEDDPRDIELTLAALSKSGLPNEIVIARDGADALDYMYSRGHHASRDGGYPAVVLLDLKLPKVTGLDVLATLKTDQARRHVPIVMLTSSREEKDLLAAYQHGVNAFVVKPLAFAQFKNTVREVATFWTSWNEPPPVPAADYVIQPSGPGRHSA